MKHSFNLFTILLMFRFLPEETHFCRRPDEIVLSRRISTLNTGIGKVGLEEVPGVREGLTSSECRCT